MNLTHLALPLALASLLSCARAENIVFPATSGVLNVRDARFGARGDGTTDDTAAIQKALSEGLGQHRIVYLPNGKYLVSDTLKWNSGDPKAAVGGWGPFLQLQGQSRAGTVIQLKSRAPGFGDRTAPRAVIQTGSSGSHGNKPYQNGEGNEAFENHIRNLSVDTGTGNAGAIGIDYQVSNCGAMRAVSIRSGDGSGVAGLSLLRRDNGPGLIKDVRIEGFDYAVRFGQDVAQMILEDVDISGQKVAGIANRDGILCLRHLRSRNQVPALRLAGNSLTVLLDSRLQGQGQAINQTAVECEGNESRLLVRALEASGYSASIGSRGKQEKRLKLAEWLSDAPLGTGGPMSLGLQVLETPTWFDEDSSRWADVGAPSGGDDTKSIQAALDSGRSTVFLRHGRYHISRPLRVPRGVRRIQGLGCEVSLLAELGDEPMLRFEGGRAGDLTIVDRCALGSGKGWAAEHADARTLVLTDLIIFGERVLRNRVGSGPLFIEDVPGAGYKLAPNTRLWARQWDIEGNTVENDGATVWALGWKTESGHTLVRNLNGGRMELLGGFVYTFGVEPETPAFENAGSLALSFQGANFSGGPNGFFNILVRDASGAAPRLWARSLAPARGNAASVPLLLLRSNRRPVLGTIPLQVLAVPTRAPLALGATAETFEAPLNGRGEAVPNAMWRLDQVWPDDVLKSENYKPMPWRDDHYEAAGYSFGNAQARVGQDGVRLDVRSAWGAEGDMAGSKLAALVFRAPRAGRYSLSGTARASVWQGEGKVLLSAFKRDAARGTVGRLGAIVTPKDSDVALRDADIVAELEAGQELVLVFEINGWYTGANLHLKNLKLSIR